MFSEGWLKVRFQWVLQQTLAALRPVLSSASTTSSWLMWLFGSTPSKPASWTIRIFSSTEPLTPTVPHMMAFFRDRLACGVADALSAALDSREDNVMAAAAVAESFRKSRREAGALNVSFITRLLEAAGILRPGRNGVKPAPQFGC